jgi:hypothetical protein
VERWRVGAEEDQHYARYKSFKGVSRRGEVVLEKIITMLCTESVEDYAKVVRWRGGGAGEDHHHAGYSSCRGLKERWCWRRSSPCCVQKLWRS